MADRKERLAELLRFASDDSEPALRRFTVVAQLVAELEEWLRELESMAKAEGHDWPSSEQLVDALRKALSIDSPGIAIDLTADDPAVRPAGEDELRLVQQWIRDPDSLPRAACQFRDSNNQH